MKAIITSISELNERKQITVVFDILSGEDVVVRDQSLVSQPSAVQEQIKVVLRDYEEEANLAELLEVGQVIDIEG